jgi:hypothetical protein
MSNPFDAETWTASVWSHNGLVFYTVDAESVSYNFEDDGNTASMIAYCLWEDLDFFKDGVIGYPTIVGNIGSAGSYISRSVPLSFDAFTNSSDEPYLFARKMSGNGYGVPPDAAEEGIHDPETDLPNYYFAKSDITFETLTYEIMSDEDMVEFGFVDDAGNPDESELVRYVTILTNPSAEYLTLPQGGFYFFVPGYTGEAVVVQGGVGKIVCSYDLAITHHSIPRAAVPSAILNPGTANPAIDNSLGCVNATEFAGQPPASLLLVGAALRPVRSTVGDRLYDLELHWKYLNAQTPVNDPQTGNPIPVGNQGVYYQGQAATDSNPAATPGYYEVTTKQNVSNLETGADNINIYNYAEMRDLFRTYASGNEDGGE